MKINATDLSHIAEGVVAIEAAAQQFFDLIEGELTLALDTYDGRVQIAVAWSERSLQPLEISDLIEEKA